MDIDQTLPYRRMLVKLDKNGKIIGSTNDIRRLAYDKDGNVIGYVDEDGSVRDFKGNVIGKVDANGNIIDANGNIIGYADSGEKIAYDANGKPMFAAHFIAK